MKSPNQSLRLLQSDLQVVTQSLTELDGAEFALADIQRHHKLVVVGNPSQLARFGLEGEASDFSDRAMLICPVSPKNAQVLRTLFVWLNPALIGTKTSAGLGDRLGLATPGHVRAVKNTAGQIAPIFAQQSMREMARTGRTPQQVMDDALWGVFQEGWHTGFGADADHLKTTDDIESGLAAGFTFFTIDPGEYVDNRAESASLSELMVIADSFPAEIRRACSITKGQTFSIEGISITFDDRTLFKAMVKYGRAVQHVATLFHHLRQAAGQRPYELEVSVDETDQPTSHAEHIYIASELKRLGVTWVSLAPRFVGRFEKGVDYLGDLDEFETDIAGHAAISRAFGGYKLSLHSGSDKFSIYPIAMRQTHGLVHLKTAGTSYLEALRTIAGIDEALFEEIYVFARSRYETDRVSYHVSARLEQAPLAHSVLDWTSLVDQFDAREILHVTFGSVLKAVNPDGSPKFYNRLMNLLNNHPQAYAENLEKHFNRHLTPFVRQE